MFRRTGSLLFLALVAVALTASVAVACPTCKVALASHDPNHGDVVHAYMYSILFMMAMPFVLLGSFGSYIYWQIRRARREAAHAAASSASVHQEEPAVV